MQTLNRLAMANTLGTFLEYFDYTLYGFSAPLIAQLFFPNEDKVSAMLMAWGVFFISFLVRPFGAVLIGHLGDRYGRRKVLSACILLMALPTCLIGFLPTYGQVGLFAPIALIFCRLLQGLAISGEFAGCSVYLYETATRYKGFLSSLTTCASGFGMLAASLWIFLFTHLKLTHYFVNEHYWRLPFIIAGLLICIVGYYLRRHMPETPEFLNEQANERLLKQPLTNIIQHQPMTLFMSTILAAYTSFMTYTLMVYMMSYLSEELHCPMSASLLITAFIGFIESIAAPYFAYLSDCFGRIRIMSVGTLGILITAIPLFKLMQVGELYIVIGSLIFLSLCLASFDGPMMAYILDQFNVGKRYSGLGVSYNLGVGIIGGSAPLLLTFLIAKTHNPSIPGFFLSAIALIVLLVLWGYAVQRKSIL